MLGWDSNDNAGLITNLLNLHIIKYLAENGVIINLKNRKNYIHYIKKQPQKQQQYNR